MKICTKCKIKKDFNEFANSSKSKDKKKSICKECHNKAERERYNLIKDDETFKRKQSDKSIARYWANPEAARIASIESYNKNRKGNTEYSAKRKIYMAGYKEENYEELCLKKRLDYALNRDARLAAQKRSAQTPEGRAKRNTRTKKRREIDINFKISNNIRSRMSMAMRYFRDNQTSSRIKYLGCTWEFFVKYLESLFYNGMTFNSYGKKGWHVDEIIPCSAWDFSNEDHIKACFHYTNRQPLWGKDNFGKGGVRSEGKSYWQPFIEDRLNMLRMMNVI